MKKRYYIAYGSNLNIRQMKIRCPLAKIAGTSEIPNYELLFKGSKTGSYLTIEPRDSASVPVAVWETTATDEEALDYYEGFPAFYYKTEMKLPVKNIQTGKTVNRKAYVYIMHEDRPHGIPSSHYVHTCLEGYHDFGFDEEILFKAVENSKRICYEQGIGICPKCCKAYGNRPAISRVDNETLICPDCGIRESLESISVQADEQDKILETIDRFRHGN